MFFYIVRQVFSQIACGFYFSLAFTEVTVNQIQKIGLLRL